VSSLARCEPAAGTQRASDDTDGSNDLLPDVKKPRRAPALPKVVPPQGPVLH